MSEVENNHPKYRPDIDGLRAVAILSVVQFHAFPAVVPGGFVGVDVFFVISGFLISSIILKGLEAEKFSLVDFYARRIRRIFPALIAVLGASFLAGCLILFPEEQRQLLKHISFGSAFLLNVLLWSESGYFDTSAEVKPLLHLWSLGVEEQFYIVWPPLLMLAWRKGLRISLLIAVAFVSSFLICLFLIKRDAAAAFYFPHARFWEFLVGGLIAWKNPFGNESFFLKVIRLSKKFCLSAFSAFGFVVLGCCFVFIDGSMPFPGFLAVLPVFSSALIIAAGSESWVNRRVLSNRVLVWFGLISFPLYLWHWPLLVFARIAESETPGVAIRGAAVVISIFLAWLTYRLIERPIRFGGNLRMKTVVLFLALIIVGFFSIKGANAEAMAGDPAQNCLEVFPKWASVTDTPCFFQNKTGNTIAIVGDSHAGHLFSGMSSLAGQGYGVAVFPASCAAPYIDIATGQNNKDERVVRIRSGAYELINSAYSYILKNKEIKTVMLAHQPACSYQDATDKRDPGGKDYRVALANGMKRTFSALVAAGKEVVVLLDNPPLPYDPEACAKRPFRITEKADRCSFSRDFLDKDPAFSAYRSLVEAAAIEYPGVRVVDLSTPLCREGRCYISIENKILYSDRNHLNNDGSRYVSEYLMSALTELRRAPSAKSY